MQGQWDSYESAIKQISNSHEVRRGDIDVMAMSRGDYESVLRIESIELQQTFRERHGYSVDAERRYVHRGLWNASRSFGRARRVRVKQMENLVEGDVPATTQMMELERSIEVRDAIRILKRTLAPGEYHVLSRVAEHGKMSQAWDPEVDGAYKNFQRRVHRARGRAREILRK